MQKNCIYQGYTKLYRKIPWDVYRGMELPWEKTEFRRKKTDSRYYFSPQPQFFHNFVSFHPILMFLTILESGDKTKNIEDEFKTI